MKALITSDLHCQKGIFTDICIDYLKFIEKYYFDNELDYIFFAGDMFEKSNKINHDAFVPLFKTLLEMKDNDVEMIFILGNHDIYNVDNASIVETFAPFGQVITDVDSIFLGGHRIDFLSYTKDRNLIPNKGDVLITHLDIGDFSFDNEYKVPDAIAFPRELFKGYKRVFTGHYHRFQHKGNITYQGSPYQLNFGEAGTKKGFCVYDFETNETDFVQYKGAPEFLKMKAEDFATADVKNKFVSVEINTKIENYVKLKHVLYEMGALDIVPYFKTNEENIEVNGKMDFDFNNSIQSLVRDYLGDYVKVEGLDNKRLIGYFDGIVKELV